MDPFIYKKMCVNVKLHWCLNVVYKIILNSAVNNSNNNG
jgi:hypothetical protein